PPWWARVLSEQHSIGRRLLPPSLESWAFLVFNHRRAHDEEMLQRRKLFTARTEDVAHDPVTTDSTGPGNTVQLVVHPLAAATGHRAYRASGDSAAVGTHRRSARESTDLINGVLALIEHRVEPGLHVGQAGAGNQVCRRAARYEGLALVEGPRDGLEEQRSRTGVRLATVPLDEGLAAGSGRHREDAVRAGRLGPPTSGHLGDEVRAPGAIPAPVKEGVPPRPAFGVKQRILCRPGPFSLLEAQHVSIPTPGGHRRDDRIEAVALGMN